ncbi:DNA-binding protein [Candidatus Bathyarchaeota archaeon]|nr:MAG: DNA-binding protein [Candidatus Bathyarchaeota archaeon]
MNLSGEYVAKLKRRALSFLKEAEEAVDLDLAAFFAEQSMQLYLKAVLYELFGEVVRGHGLRTLLGLLSRGLERNSYSELAFKVRGFVDQHRGELVLAEEAYIGGRYGDLSYSQDDVGSLINVARDLKILLDEVVKDVKLG